MSAKRPAENALSSELNQMTKKRAPPSNVLEENASNTASSENNGTNVTNGKITKNQAPLEETPNSSSSENAVDTDCGNLGNENAPPPFAPSNPTKTGCHGKRQGLIQILSYDRFVSYEHI